MTNKWIQSVHPKHGALHRQLGYPESERIPVSVLQRVRRLPVGGHIHGHTVTKLMKKRAQFAMNVRR